MERRRRRGSTRTDADTDDGTLLRRAAALVVDGTVVGALFGLALASTTLLFVRSPFVGGLALVGGWALPVVYLGYYVAFEGVYGRTPGKRLLGLVVVRRDGSACDLRAAAIRNAVRIVDGAVFYLVGATVAVLTDGDRRIGDHVAGTTVVRTRE
jgi:uncharacterized RDD family membrane protein YckC